MNPPLAYEAAKKGEGGNGANQYTKEQLGQSEPVARSTAEKLGEHFGVSASTIKRDAAFAQRVDSLPEEAKAAVLSGKEKLPKLQSAKAAEPASVTSDNPAAEPEKSGGKSEGSDSVSEGGSQGVSDSVSEGVSEGGSEGTNVSSFTIDDIKTIPLYKPHEGSLLIYRSINRASDHLASLESVTLKEQESLLQGVNGLKVLLNKMTTQIQELLTREPEDAIAEAGEPLPGESDSEEHDSGDVSEDAGDF